MILRSFQIRILSILLLLGSALSAQTTAPNVLIFFIDDLGWTDIGVNGSSFHETPHIDALAAEGVNFKRSYAANPVCSPTRAALMTGKAPQRVGITQWISGDSPSLDLSEFTIGEAFQAAGYRTGYIGKWHLGKTDAVQPKYQGFAYTAAVNRAGQPASFFYPFGKGRRPSNVPDLKGYKPGDYLTDALTDKAIEFIDQSSTAVGAGPQDKPFFLCLSHYAVHTPIQAPEPLVKKYKAKKRAMLGEGAPQMIEEKYNTLARGQQGDPAYAAMMENLDWNIGRVIEHLEAKGLLENTIILFTSDNGGLAHRKRMVSPTSNAPLRSGKAWTYEGGIRIPTIISWQGHIQPATSEAKIITMDMYPTLLELAGLPLQPEQHLDGQSLLPLLQGDQNEAAEDRALMWTYPHVHGSGHQPSDAILSGDWKLIRFQSDEPTELFNLANDLGEQTNLAKQYPEKVKALEKALDRWLAQTK
ncbi:sulfatase [Coraliomargarita sp. SDUM461003]|uniref:Sulfatase n=1 Tax=Thalassobacterium maritimum TaxID=3041265 RepID=A0ABU1B1K4_9BACT|nr:sulfatase [Coraliomargarita sp. SDUM461003]MDQ8209465.1 sulfatase [Coraliomargarita sp. SDUM461003]